MKLIKAIKKDLKNKSLSSLAKELEISVWTLYKLLHNPDAVFREELLDYLYWHYGLEKDRRYRSHLKRTNWNLISQFWKEKLKENWITPYFICRKLLISDRHLRRIMNWKIKLTTKHSEVLQQLIDLLWLDEIEVKLLKTFYNKI